MGQRGSRDKDDDNDEMMMVVIVTVGFTSLTTTNSIVNLQHFN